MLLLYEKKMMHTIILAKTILILKGDIMCIHPSL